MATEILRRVLESLIESFAYVGVELVSISLQLIYP